MINTSEIVGIKLGSNCTVNGHIDGDMIRHFGEQLTGIEKPVVVVSSGDVAAGRRIAAQEGLVTEDRETLARLGKGALDTYWGPALKGRECMVSITDEHMIDPEAGGLLISDITAALGEKAIVRANQAVDQGSDGPSADNDKVMSWLARHLGPDLVAFGMGEAYGIQKDLDDKLTVLGVITPADLAMAQGLIRQGHTSIDGTGQAGSKLLEATSTVFNGHASRGLIFNARQPGALIDAIDGRPGTGTWILNENAMA